MPGYINYWFKEGKLSAHTKEEFKKFNIDKFINNLPNRASFFPSKI